MWGTGPHNIIQANRDASIRFLMFDISGFSYIYIYYFSIRLKTALNSMFIQPAVHDFLISHNHGGINIHISPETFLKIFFFRFHVDSNQ